MARKRKTLSTLLSTQPKGDPFGPIGNLPAGTRIKRGRDGSKVYEDDPDYQRKMRNKRRR